MSYRHSLWVGTVSVLLAGSIAIHASGAPEGPRATGSGAAIVEITNIRFEPAEITIKTGTTVTWTNLDPVDHDVTSGISINGRKSRNMKQTKFPDNKFSSGLFGRNESFSNTFDAEGVYDYYCNVHPFMVARIIVEQ